MPQITNITLHSFSSEDPNFPAKNLIETKVTKKWKSEKAGEKSIFVILKLDKPYKLTHIDIGNEFTGVIEISVGNSKLVPPKFQEIILATSLMSIFDAKNERNPNGLRMFGQDLFNPAVADQQWDLVKVVCTQPFNSHRQYGLSFINLHTNEEVTEKEEDSPIKAKIPMIQKEEKTPKIVPKATTKIGKFRFRDSNSDDEEETSPFAQWKNKKDNPQSTYPKVTPKSDVKSSIKEQLKAKLESESKRRRIDDDKVVKVKQDRNRSKGLFYDSSDDEPNEKLQRKIEKDKELKNSTPKNPVKPTPTKSTPSTSKFSSFIDDDDDDDVKRKRPSVSSPKENKLKEDNLTQMKPDKEIKYKPFNKLMEGVTFVISGYQNPERGIIRQKALDMGAKYKADWDDSCTHLICAYSNTPKYNQVRGKGKIISKKWIENCFIEQKMIPWRRFALDNTEKSKPESDDEILCDWHKPKSSTVETDVKMEQSDDSDGDMLIVDRRGQKSDAKIIIDSDSESDMAIVDKTNKNNIKDDKMDSKQDNVDDDSNTNRFKDEQPQNIDERNNNNNNNNSKSEIETDVYSDDDSVSSIDITTVECQAFKDKIFYLNEDLSATDKIKLKDNIKQMLGMVTKNPHKAQYIISRQGKKLPRNSKAEVVKEIWVRECFDLQAFIPTTRYRI